MRPEDAADLLRKKPVPWDDLRAARVQRRVLAEVRGRGDAPKAQPIARPIARRIAWLVAAAALIGALVWIVARLPRGAAPTRLDFADGSYVLLDAPARVVPDVVNADRIEVRQSAGSATYEVTPRPERVFVVWMDDVRVEVLGTVFRVEAIDKAVRVSVQRGRVRVSRGPRTVSLVAGEEVTLGDSDPGQASTAAAIETPALPPPPAETATATATPKLEPPPPASATAENDPGPAELFRRADSARAAGNTAEALRLLNQLVAHHPRDGRATLAVFTIGRLLSQRGEHARAAATFESLGSAFGGEALAEAALSYAAAGQSGRAKSLAAEYASRFPDGPRARQLARLAE